MRLTGYGLCSAAGIIATAGIVAAAAAKAGTAAAEQEDENENDPQAAASTPRVVTTHIKDPPIQDKDRLLRSQSILCARAFFVPIGGGKDFIRVLCPGSLMYACSIDPPGRRPLRQVFSNYLHRSCTAAPRH